MDNKNNKILAKTCIESCNKKNDGKITEYENNSFNRDFGYEDWCTNGCSKAEEILQSIKPLNK